MAGATLLAKVLERNRVLEHFSLNNCNIGDQGIQPIANGRDLVSMGVVRGVVIVNSGCELGCG